MSESLVVKIGADIKQLQSAMKQVSASVQNAGKNITNLGKTVSTRLTAPLVLLGGVALKAFAAQEQAELRLRAALNANGRAVDSLFNRYNSFAQEMQRTTVIGDETTLAMLAQAESLGLTGDSAQRAVKNSIAMQGAFGVNAESALRYTAALEEGNATMLTRYIPTLRGIEDESERAAEAQRVLAKAFSAAEAEANGVAGTFKQVKNAIGDAMEDIGKNIADAFNITEHKNAIIENIAAMRNFFASLSAEARKKIVLITAAIMGIGPAIIAIGITISTLGVIIGALTSPITLVVGAIAGLGVAILYLRDNWEAVVERISDIGWWKNAIISMAQFLIEYSPISLMIKQFNALLGFFSDKQIPNPFEGVSKALEGLKTETKDFEHEFGSLSDAFINAIKEFTGIDIRGMFTPVTAEASKLVDETERVKIGLQGIEDTAIPVSKAVVTTIDEMKESAIEMGQALQSAVSGSITSFAETLGNAFTGDAGASGFFNNLLMIVADFGAQLGKALIAAGIAAQAFQFLLSNPLGAIAAGVALVAASTAAKNLLKTGPVTSVNDALITSDGKVVKFNSADDILASKNMDKVIGGGGGGRVEVFGKLVGQDIFISSNRGSKTYGR